MDTSTGKIYDGSVEEIAKQFDVPEKQLIRLPFQKGDIVEVMGIKFKVEKIRQNPINRVMLKGIPQPTV